MSALRTRPSVVWRVALGAVLVLALILRLKGLHAPLLDHPGWRQGDTAAIARNFATLDYNIFHPQADYNGPPPNYVELELQIVPFLAATLYKLFGIHEVFGRLISVAFSVGTVALLAAFGRFLYVTRDGRTPWPYADIAGLSAALAFAIYPGSIYYGRTFMPDTAMVFFVTAALFATARYVLAGDLRSWRQFWPAAVLTAVALLAKPVAVTILMPIAALFIARRGFAVFRLPQAYVFAAVAVLPLAAYDHYVASIAEWHWASGITRLHVIPAFTGAFTSWPAFEEKLRLWKAALGMLARTMIGIGTYACALIAIVIPIRTRSRVLLWTWLGASLAYAFVVVTVERVDYYLYLCLPLAALWTGAFVAWLAERVPEPRPLRIGATVVAVLAMLVVAQTNRQAVTAYYHYNASVYRAARSLDATLPRESLVVMGHYDPSVLYYIHRKGWEEDPAVWTPCDEQSAIRKGARSFIAVERNRLRRNAELAHWLLRFPIRNPSALWPVYETDPAKMVPGAEARWRAFRAHRSTPSC